MSTRADVLGCQNDGSRLREFVRNNPNLTTLSFVYIRFTVDNYQDFLVEQSAVAHITKFSIASCNLTNQELELIIAAFAHITEFNVTSCNITNQELELITAAFCVACFVIVRPCFKHDELF